MKKLMLVALSLLVSGVVEARTSIIPNLYKNRREIHESGIAAGWSVRNSVGADINMEDSETKTAGTEVSDTDTTVYNLYSFNHFAFGLTSEVQIISGSEKEKISATGVNEETDTDTLNINLGYQLSNLPMVIGLNFINEKEEENDGVGTLTFDRERTFDLGVGYKLPNNVYLGLGTKKTRNHPDGGPSENDNPWYLGAGYISGNEKDPELAGEAKLEFYNEEGVNAQILSALGLTNQGPIEYSGALVYANVDGDVIDGSFWTLLAELDYSFTNGMYVAPKLGFTKFDLDQKGTGLKVDADGPEYGLEGGWRNEAIAAYLSYTIRDVDLDTSFDTVAVDTDIETNGFELGFNYRF